MACSLYPPSSLWHDQTKMALFNPREAIQHSYKYPHKPHLPIIKHCRITIININSHTLGSIIKFQMALLDNKITKILYFALFISSLVNLFGITLAQNTPQDYLTPHNSARAQVGVGPMTWNTTVATYAQNYANQRIVDCSPVHSGGPYGENLFWGSGREFTAGDAVNAWVAEKQYYNYAANTCATGKVCGHYTQVVWASSVQLGCGRVKCNSGAIFIICDYSPPGNYVGQRPY